MELPWRERCLFRGGREIIDTATDGRNNDGFNLHPAASTIMEVELCGFGAMIFRLLLLFLFFLLPPPPNPFCFLSTASQLGRRATVSFRTRDAGIRDTICRAFLRTFFGFSSAVQSVKKN